MGRALPITAAAVGLWWLYARGSLDGVLARLGIDTTGRAGTAIKKAWPVSLDLSGLTGIGGLTGTPALPKPAKSGGANKELELLRDNLDMVQGWAMRNLAWTAAMMHVESRGNPDARSAKGALGVMQVLPTTANDVYRWGWDRMLPTTAALLSVRGSIYFGTAYMDYLSRTNTDREWITRAYNAGPGGKRSDGTWPPETERYVAAVRARFEATTGTVSPPPKPKPKPVPVTPVSYVPVSPDQEHGK